MTKTCRFKTLTPVYVEWLDITGSKGWHSLEECPQPLLMKQMAFYVAEDKNTVLICQAYPTYEKDIQYADPTAIPKGVIRKLRKVKV